MRSPAARRCPNTGTPFPSSVLPCLCCAAYVHPHLHSRLQPSLQPAVAAVAHVAAALGMMHDAAALVPHGALSWPPGLHAHHPLPYPFSYFHHPPRNAPSGRFQPCCPCKSRSCVSSILSITHFILDYNFDKCGNWTKLRCIMVEPATQPIMFISFVDIKYEFYALEPTSRQ